MKKRQYLGRKKRIALLSTQKLIFDALCYNNETALWDALQLKYAVCSDNDYAYELMLYSNQRKKVLKLINSSEEYANATRVFDIFENHVRTIISNKEREKIENELSKMENKISDKKRRM